MLLAKNYLTLGIFFVYLVQTNRSSAHAGQRPCALDHFYYASLGIFPKPSPNPRTQIPNCGAQLNDYPNHFPPFFGQRLTRQPSPPSSYQTECARAVSTHADDRVYTAAAPPTISDSSLVIAAWRDLLYTNCNSPITFFALSEAAFMATIRADCSDAIFSATA